MSRTQIDVSLTPTPQFLSKYRRPTMSWVDVNTIQVGDTNDVSGASVVGILFPDGTYRTSNDNAHQQCSLNTTAVLTATPNAGLRSSLSRTANTWYSVYAAKSGDGKWVAVADNTAPTQANVSTLNSSYGTNGWVYIGMIRNGEGSFGGQTNQVLKFVQTGNQTLFYNPIGSGFPAGFVITNTSGTSLTYTPAAGFGDQQIPNTLGILCYNITIVPGSATEVGCQIASANTTLLRNAATAGSIWGGRLYFPGTVAINAFSGASGTLTISVAGFIDTVLGAGSNALI